MVYWRVRSWNVSVLRLPMYSWRSGVMCRRILAPLVHFPLTRVLYACVDEEDDEGEASGR